MVLIEDENLVNPSIPEPQLQYIVHLPDAHQTYTRFFDGLLIPRPSHPAFFRDLRSFRAQPTVVVLFSACNPNPDVPKEITRAKYRDITHAYLASRFAHPWCRKAMAGSAGNKGWWGAEWAATGRRMSQEAKDQEEKLHKLLVPIWVVMRGRMFPGDEPVEAWYKARLAKEEEVKQERDRELNGAVGSDSGKNEADVKLSEVNEEEEDRNTKKDLSALEPNHTQNATSKGRTNILDFWDSDEAAEEEEFQVRDKQAVHVATSVFRLAAAGLLVESMSRREKWKLKKLLKK